MNFFRSKSSAATTAAAAVQTTPSPAATERSSSRAVTLVLKEPSVRDGPGIVERPFPSREVPMMDPYLLFDQWRKTLAPGEMKPTEHLGQHPHRGFCALSYIINGGVDHCDTTGKRGKLRDGDLQILRTGGGVVHGFIPPPEITKFGGKQHGFQIWLNMPAKDRMMKPVALDFRADETPVASSADGKVWVRVLAGECLGASCNLLSQATPIPLLILHMRLQGGALHEQPIPQGFNICIHVSDGLGLFGSNSKEAGPNTCVFFDKDGGSISIRNPQSEVLDLLLLGGLPTGEHVVQRGPFVGSTQDDIRQANADFQAGLFGHLAPDGTPQPKSHWA